MCSSCVALSFWGPVLFFFWFSAGYKNISKRIHIFSLESKPDFKLSELPGDQSNSLNTSRYSCVREAGDSGAARSPEPAPMPCGSCSKAAELDSIAHTD